MKKDNIVRMINGDLENNYQFVIQIFLEIDELAPFFLENKDKREGELFDMMRKIFELGF